MPAGPDGLSAGRAPSTRAAAIRAMHWLDHAVGRWTSAVRVLVDVRTPMNLAVLAPVWRRLREDPRVRLAFTAEDEAAVRAALDSENLGAALMTREAASRARWDLALSADAWNGTPLRRCRRSLQFFHGVAGKYDLDEPQKLLAAGLSRVDRIAFINEDRMQRYLASGIIRRGQAVLVGFPKGDDLLNGRWPAGQVRASLRLSPTLPTVLYAPTFSTAGSLHLAGPSIVDALLSTGANVIVKLHDRSTTPHPKHTAGIDWLARLAPFSGNPRFALAQGADAGPLLSAADVLITDHSTVGFEFALLDRPIVVYDAPELRASARIAADKWTLLRSMAEIVSTPAALPGAIATALAHPERLRDERQQARALFAYPGCATARALAVVYELLALDPLEAPGASRAGDSSPLGAALRSEGARR